MDQLQGKTADVSDAASMDALGAAAFGAFHRVNVVCNNAGVAQSVLAGTNPEPRQVA